MKWLDVIQTRWKAWTLARLKRKRRIPLTGDPKIDRAIIEAVNLRSKVFWDTDNDIYIRYNEKKGIYERYDPPELKKKGS